MVTKLDKYVRTARQIGAIQYYGNGENNHAEIVKLLGKKCFYHTDSGDDRSYILFTGKDGAEQRLGAYDYLVKYPEDSYYRVMDPSFFEDNFEPLE